MILPREYGSLDARTPQGQRFLHDLNRTHRPKLVIVDTLSDVYVQRDHENVNTAANQVARIFKLAFPEAGTWFNNHERRASQNAYNELDDAGAFLGAGEWARKATTSIRLVGINEDYVELRLIKSRDLKWANMRLKRTENGFFTEQVDVRDWKPEDALRRWPNIPNLREEPGSCTSLAKMYRAIHLAVPGLSEDALKQAKVRANRKGVHFQFEALAQGEREIA